MKYSIQDLYATGACVHTDTKKKFGQVITWFSAYLGANEFPACWEKARKKLGKRAGVYFIAGGFSVVDAESVFRRKVIDFKDIEPPKLGEGGLLDGWKVSNWKEGEGEGKERCGFCGGTIITLPLYQRLSASDVIKMKERGCLCICRPYHLTESNLEPVDPEVERGIGWHRSNGPKVQAVIEWLYLNDGAYSSAKEWRKAFIEFLKTTL